MLVAGVDVTSSLRRRTSCIESSRGPQCGPCDEHSEKVGRVKPRLPAA